MKGYQFSLRMLLAAIAVGGVSIGALTAKSDWLAGVLMIVLATVFPAVLFGGACHAQRSQQTFFVGAFIPAATAFFFGIHQIAGWSGDLFNPHVSVKIETLQRAASYVAYKFRLPFGFLWAAMPLLGAICGLLDRIFISGGKPPEPNA